MSKIDLCQFCFYHEATTTYHGKASCDFCRGDNELEDMIAKEYDMDVVMTQFWDLIDDE